MYVIQARNVHQALPKGIDYLRREGVRRRSRNGDVLVSSVPVATVYERPIERLSFWEHRPVNVAFLLAEALWMLAGRNDLKLPATFIKDFGRYSDDGETLHGAYGYRWRRQFDVDQLDEIVRALSSNADDRRAVLQMWDTRLDLGRDGKDVPCNTMATFQIGASGALDMTVFCRSNDIIWGAYFANAFHFGLLLDYLADRIGVLVGTYTQVSVNYHAYVDVFQQYQDVVLDALDRLYAVPALIRDPYRDGTVWGSRFFDGTVDDGGIDELLLHVSSGFSLPVQRSGGSFELAYIVLRSNHLLRTLPSSERFDAAIEALSSADQANDMVMASRQWIDYLRSKSEEKAYAEIQ